jgi:hypothetical protein
VADILRASVPPGLIFVSIASYRDPQLVPTVRDCLENARNPERLRFGICWQHASDEQLPDWFDGDQFTVLDVDYRKSGGTCWARAQVMELWKSEDWYLQLDSHHRFVPDWDVLLLGEAARTGSDRPVLTTYAPAFLPAEPIPAERIPMSIQFMGFHPDGSPWFSPSPIDDWEQRTRPHRARFVSGHFLFAPGSFIRDVPYDPELYYHGQEITLAVRAFTHGYDLFEPSRVIVWHEYERLSQRKHWDDHLGDGGPAWHERDAVSRTKVRRLLDEPDFGPFGLGTERTLEDYEAYAGISFRHRKVQDYTFHNLEPPNPPMNRDWPQQVRDHRTEITVAAAQLSRQALDDADHWFVAVHDPQGRDIHRARIPQEELAELERKRIEGHPLTLTVEFQSQAHPATWTMTPHSKTGEWLPPLTGTINANQSVRLDAQANCAPESDIVQASVPPGLIFVSIASYRDPQLVPTVRDCLENARNPERLRFGICWQHASDEQLPDWFDGDQFRVLDVDWRESRGACWARARVMDLWDGEDWYLQLDSHHRFVPDWDVVLLGEAARTGSDRPVLTTYAPPFSLPEPQTRDQQPMRMEFDGFHPDGIPKYRPSEIWDWQQRTRPHRARFLSAHLLFAPGTFVRDVPYDPELYFTGEEITLAVRAFTHGYDLFEPSRVIVWHEYERLSRRKHWDDHLGDGGPAWHERDAVSRTKVRRVLDEPDFGPFGLGTERTLEDYEAYAGISFRHRKVQDYTFHNLEPPNPPMNRDWPQQVRDHRTEITVAAAQLSRQALDDADHWFVAVHDPQGRDIHRARIPQEELAELERKRIEGHPLTLTVEFQSQAHPATWTMTPHSKTGEWLPPLTGTINAKPGPSGPGS